MALSGFPWDQLAGSEALQALQTFLGDQEHESQHWEAKGVGPDSNGSPRAASLRKEVGAFANSVDGGIVLLGVEEDREHGWTFPGVAVADPPTWVSDALKYNIDPRPPFEVRAIALPNGRAVVAVRVWSATTAPCMVNGGAIYERLPGSAARVESLQRLADLYARGSAATEQARRQARAASEAALAPYVGTTIAVSRTQLFVIGASPVALCPAAERLVFSREGRESLIDDLGQLARRPCEGNHDVSFDHNQNGVTASAVRFDKTCRWELTLRRDGSVAVLWSGVEDPWPTNQIAEQFSRAWELADGWITRLGQFSEPQDQCIDVLFTDHKTEAVTTIDRLVRLARGPVSRAEASAHAMREVQRVFGAWIDEPAYWIPSEDAI